MAEQETMVLGIVGMSPKGTYNSETEYEKLNIVTYQGSSYCAKKDTLGNLPTDTEYWDLIAEKGDTGSQGLTGPQGPQGIPGAPSGSPLAASSTDDMTDTTQIYVNTTDGKWYYYDSDNETWQIGGTYQSTGISDGSVSGIKTTFFNKSLNELRFEDGTISDIGITATIQDGVIILNGTATDDGYINVPNLNTTAKTGLYRLQMCNNYAYDEHLLVNYSIYGGAQTEGLSTYNPIIVALNNTYISRIRLRVFDNITYTNKAIYPMLVDENNYTTLKSDTFKSEDKLLISSSIFDIGKKVIDVSNTNFITKSYNLVNPDELIDGYATGQNKGILNFQGSGASYKTAIIYNNSNSSKTYYVYPKYRLYGILQNSGSNGSFTNYQTASTEPGFITVPAHARLNVSFYTSDLNSIMIAESVEAVPFKPYEYTINHLDLNNKINDIHNANILYGKKYVAFGDSFTHGDFNHAPEDDYHITDGRYYGELKVYPFIIGNRNNMTVINKAKNGMTLASRGDSTNSMIQTQNYQSLDADVDYITIKIGINDDADHQNLPLGTIDSSDTSTFYGAYNTVLTYLITNYPNAKIGLIATNGSTSDIVTATINIGAKYGIPVLNESTDTHVPLLIRTNRTDVPDTIKAIRNNNWYVSTTTGSVNYHPNAKCHEYESSIIENFLRSL